MAWTISDGHDELARYIRVWADKPKVRGACEPMVCELVFDDTIPHQFTADEAAKHARLIAAAPDLRSALEEIAAGQFNCSPHQFFMAAQGIAARAIARATNTEPQPDKNVRLACGGEET